MLATILGDPAGWLLNNGVGQNLTAGVIVFAAGMVWARTKYWPLHAIHARLDALRTSHADLHAKLDQHAAMHARHAAAIEALHQRVCGDARAKPAPRARRSAPPRSAP